MEGPFCASSQFWWLPAFHGSWPPPSRICLHGSWLHPSHLCLRDHIASSSLHEIFLYFTLMRTSIPGFRAHSANAGHSHLMILILIILPNTPFSKLGLIHRPQGLEFSYPLGGTISQVPTPNEAD